jgi:hypothetical protein
LQFRPRPANVERRFPKGEFRMKLNRIALLGLGAGALLALAGCSTPESRIQAACMKNGLMGDGGASTGQPQASPAEVKRQCECFTRNLKTNLTAAELNTVADRMSSTKAEERNQQNMPPEIAAKTMAAVKACAVP